MLELVPGTIHAPDCDLGEDCTCQPAYGTRGSSPGPRGCWAVKADGSSCGAARRRDGDFCTAHSGLGVAADPARYAPIGRAAAAVSRERRAAIRATLGITRSTSARAVLQAAVFVERERVAAAALAPISDPDVGAVARHRAALALLDAAEPVQRSELRVDVPATLDEVGELGLGELRALLAAHTPTPLTHPGA